MRLPLLPILIVLAAGVSADGYILRRISADFKGKWRTGLRQAFIAVSTAVTLWMAAVAFASKTSASETQLVGFMWAIFTYFSVYIPKYIYVLFSLAGRALGHLFKRRMRGVDIAGAALGGVLFSAMWWGALVTRYSIDVREVDVPVDNLPAAFNGYKIAQISDIHTGTYGDNPRFLEKLASEVNSLHPDIILFTGDIVNRHSAELVPFMDALGRLSAPDGVWSVMGNHDYGEYYRWNSESERLADVDSLRALQARMGWRMLNNSHTTLRRGSDSIIIIGVENIGEPPFTTYGSLRKAYPDLSDGAVKVLMTHNPRHWTDSIASHPDINVALSLSGHTHAMQVKILGWSPAEWRYPTWGGLYTDSLGRSLYVNIGLGEVGFPSRIGATPEVTLITLTDK